MTIKYANQGATRSLPLSDDLIKALGYLADMGVTAEVFSGGQPATGLARVGSHRHDHGGAADVFFYKDGRKLDWSNPDDVPVFEEIVRKGRQAGITGFGAGPGYMQQGSMHVGFGSPAVWGQGGKGENAPDWLRNAYNTPGAQMAAFDPVKAGAVALDGDTMSFAPDQPASPGQQAIANITRTGTAPVGKEELRPFLPSERRPNPDGSYSTEISTTWQLPDGQWVNVPSLWMGKDGPKQFNPDDEQGILGAMSVYEASSGKPFPRFRSLEEAERAAVERSAKGGAAATAFDPIKAGAVPFDPVAAGAQAVDRTVPEFDPNVPGYNPQTGMVEHSGAMDRIGAFLTGAIEGVPIAGPTLRKGVESAAAGIVAPFSEKDYSNIRAEMGRNTDQVQRDNPGTTLAGNITGAVGTMVPLGATALGGRMLGMTGGSLATRSAVSGASNAVISAADTAARGGTLADIMKSGRIGLGVGAALPGVGAGLNAAARGVYEAVGPRVNAILRPTEEAGRRVGLAMTRDAQNTAAPVLGAADEASAAINNQTLMNVDRGGEATRALARSAANSDPEARAIIAKTAEDRFSSQGDRARSFISRITNGATDDLALQDSLRAAARKANGPAYAKAYDDGERAIWSPELERLSSAPIVVDAMKGAQTIWRNVAIADGYGAMNPGALVDRGGKLTFLNGKVPVFPNLQFWDYTKRIIDDEIGSAVRSGADQKVRTLTQIKSALSKELDKQVPSYAAARQGAARFFGAEDALDAGKKFVTQNRTLDETRQALAKMSQEERATFAVGFASELGDAIKQAGDRTNVIKKIFGSEQAREKIRLALGPKAYGEFEQFVKVENAMDMLRGAMGNSTTARQLAELGLAGGAGVGATALTGDWKQGITAAVLTGLARRGGAKIDERITKRVAELLLSDDPKAIQQAVTLAAGSPKHAAALDAIQTTISAAVRGMGVSAGRPEKAPLEITVTPN